MTESASKLAPGQKTDPAVCRHPKVEPGPRPDRETCTDCLSNWARGTVTGTRDAELEIQRRTEAALAKLERQTTESIGLEVERRVAAELERRAKEGQAGKGGKSVSG
jgi:hypothetical protein